MSVEGDCELDSPTPVPGDPDEGEPEHLFSRVIDDCARKGILDVCDGRADPDSACRAATSNENVNDPARVLSSEVDTALERREQTRRSRVGCQLTSPVEPSDEMPLAELREGRADLDSPHATRGDLGSCCRLRGYGDPAARDHRDPDESAESQQGFECSP